MKKYTVYNSTTEEVIAASRPWPTADGITPPAGLPADVHLLEEIKVANPPYDSATQRLGSYGAPVYDTGPAKTATRTREVVALTADELARNTRETQREAMRTSWAGLNANVRGNYQWLFDNVQTFLDAGDDDLAVIAVQEVDANEAIANTPARLTNFNNTKAQFVATIQALTPLP